MKWHRLKKAELDEPRQTIYVGPYPDWLLIVWWYPKDPDRSYYGAVRGNLTGKEFKSLSTAMQWCEEQCDQIDFLISLLP